ncbi:MAG: hypothetical protein LIO93_05045 [Bacteroidales bacterium]|nr:hypothetical protein [Bacteroidales bacterium]
MTKIIIFLLFLYIFFASCIQTPRTIDPELFAIDSIIETYPDSALFTLEEMMLSADNFDNYNKAYYYVLLAAAQNKKGVSLIESDVLIDFAIKVLNKKRDMDLLSRAY